MLTVATGRSLLRGPVYPDELSGDPRHGGNGGVDSTGLSGKIRIERADDDTGMLGTLPVEADEVLAIDREDGAVFSGGEGKDLLIRDA